MDEGRAALAVSTAALVVGVYGSTLPTLADARAQRDKAGHLAASQQYAAILGCVVVLGVAAVTRSGEVALVGAAAVVALAAAYKLAADYE